MVYPNNDRTLWNIGIKLALLYSKEPTSHNPVRRVEILKSNCGKRKKRGVEEMKAKGLAKVNIEFELAVIAHNFLKQKENNRLL